MIGRLLYSLAKRTSSFPPIGTESVPVDHLVLDSLHKAVDVEIPAPQIASIPTLTTVISANQALAIPESSTRSYDNLLVFDSSCFCPNWALDADTSSSVLEPPWGFDSNSLVHDASDQILDSSSVSVDSAPFHADPRILEVEVSVNLLIPICVIGLFGKEYGYTNVVQQSIFDEPEPTTQHEPRKSYRAIVHKGCIEKLEPSIWDMLFPMLLPPINLEFASSIDFPFDLRNYQKTGISFLLERESALLGDEMGTGKTVITTVAMRLLFRKGSIQGALVVCPKSVLDVWDKHLSDWAPELSVTVVSGLKSNRLIDWSSRAHVYVSSYDTVREDGPDGTDSIPEATLNRLGLVVIDEAQYIKNPSSGRAKAIKKLKPTIRWALSGTPVENRIEDLMAIFDFVKPHLFRGKDLFTSDTKRKIRPYFLRREKKTVMPELPPKIRQDIWLEMDQDQKREYDEAYSSGRSNLTRMGKNITKVHIFTLLNKLKQICNFATGKYTSPKTEALTEKVDEIRETGKKVLVYSQYVERGVDVIEESLKDYGCVKFTGDLSSGMRNEAISRFTRDQAVTAFLATTKSGGIGITLTEASYVVHFDHWWNPAIMWQAEDRAHRFGQTEPVNVYSFWMRDTIDERIHAILKRKGLLHQEVISEMSEEQIDNLVSTEDWLEALELVPDKKESDQDTIKGEAKRDMQQCIELISGLDPYQFEELVKNMFVKLGFINAKTTKKSHDGGVDIIATKSTIGGVERIIVQCKHRPVIGVDVARELLGTIESHPEITKGYLVVSGQLSQECLVFCQHSGRLATIAGAELAQRVSQLGVSIPT